MKIVIAGGGTGGHLYPGIAVAEELLDRGVHLTFLATRKPFDRRELEKRRIPYRTLPSPQGLLSPKRIVPLTLRFSQSVLMALKFYQDFRPRGVLGTGGFGSLPPIFAARLAGIPYAVMEQNAIPGKANRLVASGAAALFSQWEEARGYFKNASGRFRHVGSPLRAEFAPIPRGEAKRRLGIDPTRFCVLVAGGSQGAESLNGIVIRELPLLSPYMEKIHIVHLTGEQGAERAREAYGSSAVSATVIPFSDEMPLLYSAADLIVSRAGALAIAEIAHFGIPSLLIPYPHAADGHQSLNARILANAGAAIMLEEREYAPGKIEKIIGNFLDDAVSCTTIGEGIKRFDKPNARREIAGQFLDCIENRSTPVARIGENPWQKRST